jgi:hypothetical protein
MNAYDVDTVTADPVTGEWLEAPIFTGAVVSCADWAKNVDTEAAHYDTYERDGKTRAIIVRWIREVA